MTGNLQVREAELHDLKKILDLIDHSLGEGWMGRSTAYWNWKHVKNPFGPSPVLVAETEGRIVGVRAFLRWRWEVDGILVPAVRAVDTATHQDFRSMGIFKRLTLEMLERMRAEGQQFVFNTPNQLSLPGYIKMGWANLGRVTLWVRPVRRWQVIRAMRRLRGMQSIQDDKCLNEKSVVNMLESKSILSLLEDRGGVQNKLSTPLSSDYLRWRYVEIPRIKYYASWNKEHNSAIIFRPSVRAGLRELRVCEIVSSTNSKSRSAVASLLRGVIRRANPHVVTAMATWGTREAGALLRSGFIPVPRSGPVLTVRSLSDPPARQVPINRGDFGLSIGDLELF